MTIIILGNFGINLVCGCQQHTTVISDYDQRYIHHMMDMSHAYGKESGIANAKLNEKINQL